MKKKLLASLKEQKVNPSLIKEADNYGKAHRTSEDDASRIPSLSFFYYGADIWEMAIAAILEGENILLSGPKATGKNVLADNLAVLFERPTYTMSFNTNTDSASLIGADTFENNTVTIRKGPVYQCAIHGGFGIFDEINMAKNDAVSVLHATLDHRRIIDIPGYEKITLNEATRFIGTMNYGYAGTKELNEALVSRFLVIDMPAADETTLMKIFLSAFPDASKEKLKQFALLFIDLQLKALNGEISTKPVDLRGMLSSLRTVRAGLKPSVAIKMGVSNKSFDIFEREIINDVIMTRIPEEWETADIFGK